MDKFVSLSELQATPFVVCQQWCMVHTVPAMKQ
jgi:hypothetical protein